MKKKNALIQVSMSDAMDRIKTFVKPLLDKTADSVSTWNPEKGRWD